MPCIEKRWAIELRFVFLINFCLRWAPSFASCSFVCFVFVLRTHFEYFVWRLCCVSCCSVPKASLVALHSEPSQTKALQDTPFEVCRIFFFFTACPWQQHLGPWITSLIVSMAEINQVLDVALATTSFLCPPLFFQVPCNPGEVANGDNSHFLQHAARHGFCLRFYNILVGPYTYNAAGLWCETIRILHNPRCLWANKILTRRHGILP